MNEALGRRGLMAGAAALVAGGLARLAGTERAQAAHDTGGSPEALHAGVLNSVGGQTTIFSSAGQALFCDGTDRGITGFTSNTSGVRLGVVGTTTSFSLPNDSCGVFGNTPIGNGVLGNASSGFGVRGVSGSEGPGSAAAGVWGTSSNSNGVTGTSTNLSGVFGIAGGLGPGLGAPAGEAGTSFAGIGVLGTSRDNNGVVGNSTMFNGVIGVIGVTGGLGPALNSWAGVYGTSVERVGVFGSSTNNFGVRGLSTSNVGVYAESVSNTGAFAAGARGVWGRATNGIGVLAQATQGGTAQNRSYGIYAAAPGPGWAGYFEGNVYVTGQVFTPGGALSMAQAADGSQRTLYSQDSTEPVVEDFGEGTLAKGQASVTLDADFAAVADGGAYQVFLTAYGDLGSLYVTARTPTTFTVHSPTGAGGAFGYRVVAKRRGTAGKRLERLERPKGLSAGELEPPKLPKLPELPAREPEKPTPGDRPGQPLRR